MAIIDFFSRPLESLLKLSSNTITALQRLKIYTVRDLIFHKPHSYLYKKINPIPNEVAAGDYIVASVKVISKNRGNKTALRISCSSSIGYLTLIFFHTPPIFISAKLYPGSQVNIEGKLENQAGYWQIIHPELVIGIPMMIEPIYPLTYGLANKRIHQYITRVIAMLPELEELEVHTKLYAPLLDLDLPKFSACIKNIHMPQNLKLSSYYRRLVFDEILANQLACIDFYSSQSRINEGMSFGLDKQLQLNVLNRLKLIPTPNQLACIAEIEADQVSAQKMIRLLQGDVGVGKTLVALLTILNVVSSGLQAVLMVPTDLLAKQHHKFFVRALEHLDIKVGILTSKIKGPEKRQALQDIAEGSISILIGTHALFQDRVAFKNLGYVVIDEQHRFGVLQRLSLVAKGKNPDLLVMTATPIPRSLALASFGNINTSELRAKISGRKPIKTISLASSQMAKIISNIQSFIARGERIYWVCPLIQASENLDQNLTLQDVQTRFTQLEQHYKGQVAVIHGKLSIEQRNLIMEQFRLGVITILVATTVIEVGIDVPEATLMIIEEAQQFGLAQLHQLRGRVGRSDRSAYCILIYKSKYLTDIARKRLAAVCQTEDGFAIAEQDLILRGQGEMLGEKQSGAQRFFFASDGTDADLFEKINKIVVNPQLYNSISNKKLLLEVFSSARQEVYDAI